MLLLQDAGGEVVPGGTHQLVPCQGCEVPPGLPHQCQGKHSSLPNRGKGEIDMTTAETAGLSHCPKPQWPGSSSWAGTLEQHQSRDSQPLTYTLISIF